MKERRIEELNCLPPQPIEGNYFMLHNKVFLSYGFEFSAVHRQHFTKTYTDVRTPPSPTLSETYISLHRGRKVFEAVISFIVTSLRLAAERVNWREWIQQQLLQTWAGRQLKDPSEAGFDQLLSGFSLCCRERAASPRRLLFHLTSQTQCNTFLGFPSSDKNLPLTTAWPPHTHDTNEKPKE